MAELVNLRTVRKRKARADKERTAQQNRVAHGLTKGQRQTAEALRARDAAALDAHRREGRDDEA